MGKQGKSSATSGTRKKHARKAATHDPSIAIVPAAKSQGKGKGKGKNKEPRVKQYIPPPKYKPLVDDPIESLSVASVLPPNMVLCFKGLSKKDPVTKMKALDDLATMLDDESWNIALPVWLWHFVSLSVHPNRRLRESSAIIHSKLFEQPILRDEAQSYILREPNAGTFLAAWALGANDVVPTIANTLRVSWDLNITWHTTAPQNQFIDIQDHVEYLVATLLQAIIDPEQLYQNFAPLLAASSKDLIDVVDTGEYLRDRNGRIRTAGLNSITWIIEGPSTIAHSVLLGPFRELLSSNILLGTILSAQPSVFGASDIDDEKKEPVSWGYEQRAVRMAGWKLIKEFVKYLQNNQTDIVEEISNDDTPLPLKLGYLRNLGCAALRSAWVETDSVVRTSMWEGLLPLITVFPEVWDMDPINQALIGTSQHTAAESDSSEDIEDGPMETVPNGATRSHPATSYSHLAFNDFLHFLELGCRGSATQSYPAIVVVLSTIPEAIFPYEPNTLERLFTSLWAAYDGKALSVLPRDREPAGKAFLSCVLDCVIFFIQKLHTPTQLLQSEHRSELQPGKAVELVPLKWIARIIQEVIHGDLSQNVPVDTAGQLIGESMKKLEHISPDMTRLAWRVEWEPVLIQHQPQADRNESIIKLLGHMRSAARGGINQEIVDKILKEKVQVKLEGVEGCDSPTEQARVLISLWEHLNSVTAPWLVEVTDQVWNAEVLDRMVRIEEPRGIIIFLNGYLSAPTASENCRRAIWSQFLSACAGASAFSVLRDILDLVGTAALTVDEVPALFDLTKSWMVDLAQGNPTDGATLGSVLVHWKICLSQTQALEILELLLSAFILHARELLFSSSDVVSPVIQPIAHVLDIVLTSDTSLDFYTWPTLNFADAGALLRILPNLYEAEVPFARFYQWDRALKSWSTYAPVELQSESDARARELIRSLLISCSTSLSARDVLTVAVRSALYLDEKMILLEMIPSQYDFDQNLDDLNDNPSPVLAEYDPLVRLGDREPDSLALATYDSHGLSKYARVGTILATTLSEDRHLARDNLWTFRHLLALQQLSLDFVSAATWPSEVFRVGASSQVHTLLGVLAPLAIYLGNSLLADHSLDWHKQIISRLQNPGSDPVAPQNAEEVIHQYYSIATRNSPTSRDLRLLRRIMQFVLRDAETDILDLWSDFAQSAYSHYSEAAEAIGDRVHATAESSLSRPSFTKMDVGDEELDTSMEALVTVLLGHLLPILQTIRGAHWEFILDVLENNLSVETSITNLYLLLQTLRAITIILNLITTNQQLTEIWAPRQHDIFQGILQLFLNSSGDAEDSETRVRYNSYLAEVIQAIPSEQIHPDLFEKLFSLVFSESVPIKLTAHYLARRALSQITEQRVLEAAVNAPSVSLAETDVQAEKSFELPHPLVEKLVSSGSSQANYSNIDLLLAWWLALEFFDKTSLKIKQDYFDQLRRLNLVKTSLLPCLFKLLNLGISGEKPFNLSPWQVDVFYLNLYDNSFTSAENVLAAHIYFKSLKFIPALIRAWYSECQDRQLCASVSAYTRNYFSPTLINQELAHFRASAASASEILVDDTFTVKVAPSVNEISASYAVDEQESFEVAIRLPNEYPLRAAEVKDVRGVAGMENRRRAWLFGVQNMAQQGLIYDGLVMYKKNIAGHFEGKSECAICYS
ncbi:E3 ubiquitin-protein ligase listerin [Rhizoctonia solani]|uniref:E3 ubiquitin-protein ligase listerin n=1 Tax=Rhizoctonia solani TaxID=456999 RepID=A0A8H8P2N3_9AGAM|nr:E3 ubiquitin-protein ligase listerin [Rhizoctonia solani]QRW23508.1 E3 ubiquitin-protein ligase listerin [Rhizoctonia solani]